MLHARASRQRHREHVRLLPPVQAVAGHAATANGDNIMETQKQSAIDSPFSACGKYIEWGNDMRRNKSMRRSLRPIYKTSRTEKTVRDVCIQRR